MYCIVYCIVVYCSVYIVLCNVLYCIMYRMLNLLNCILYFIVYCCVLYFIVLCIVLYFMTTWSFNQTCGSDSAVECPIT